MSSLSEPRQRSLPPERVTCEDVQVGDHIARTRVERFEQVVAINEGPRSRRLIFNLSQGDRQLYGQSIRPRRTAKLWRLPR